MGDFSSNESVKMTKQQDSSTTAADLEILRKEKVANK
jgi:hypothetical protein